MNNQQSYLQDSSIELQQINPLSSISAKTKQIQNKLSQLINLQYQNVIVCDITAIDPTLYDQIQQAQQQIRVSQWQKAQLTQKYRQNQMIIQQLKKKIEGLEQMQKSVLKINQQKSIKEAQEQYKKVLEQQAKLQNDIKLKIQTSAVDKLIQSKEKTEKKVLQFLNKQIQKEDKKINDLRMKIDKQRRHMDKDKDDNKILQILNGYKGQFIDDKKQALNYSISNMRKYIEMNKRT